MQAIQAAGAIGDVCGRFFDINGKSTALDFQKRLIGISREDLVNIPLRMGVAGGDAKVNPIIGALRGKFINILITDVKTAQAILSKTDCSY
jgi:DNA-binding transcriptional regulator LsrR (DeoR family)